MPGVLVVELQENTGSLSVSFFSKVLSFALIKEHARERLSAAAVFSLWCVVPDNTAAKEEEHSQRSAK